MHLPDTVARCVQQLTQQLTKAHISEARVSAELIVASAVGQKTLHSVKRQTVLSASQLENISQLTKKRLQRMPLQYVLGDWDFRSLTLTMRSPVLIPRPETEELVGYALKDCTVKRAKRGLEIGCGSGAICLSLLNEHPTLEMTAVDQSPAACELTLENARMLQLIDRLSVHNVEVTADSGGLLKFGGGEYDFLISNPPYICTDDIQDLQPEISEYEDHAALDGGPQGLDVIASMLTVVPHVLRHRSSIWLEVDSKHPMMIAQYVRECGLPIQGVQVLPDFQKISRFCHLKFVPTETDPKERNS